MEDGKDTDDASTSSDKQKEDKYSNETPLDLNDDYPPLNLNVNALSQSRHHQAQESMHQLAPKQQKAMAQEMFSQMKQLKAQNEAMGYHGYSGHLQKHESRIHMAIPETPVDSHKTAKYSTVLHEQSITDDYTDGELSHKQSKRKLDNKSSVILSETQGLKHKLETVSSHINKIRHALQQNNGNKDLSVKQLNQLIMSFQNQLTDIQDQIEDAETDIESHIDVKFIKYLEEIERNKQKIKTMKRDKKEKEKELQMNKDKEQQRIIELQKLQIEQLISQQSNSASAIEQLSPSGHQINPSIYYPLDASPYTNAVPVPVPVQSAKRNRQLSRTMSVKHKHSAFRENRGQGRHRKRKDSIQSAGTILRYANGVNEEEMGYMNRSDYAMNAMLQSNAMIESECSENEEMEVQYVNGNIFIPGMTTGQTQLQQMNVDRMRMSANASPNYIEGGYQTRKEERVALLSDNAVKIIGGVVIVLAGLYVLGKYLSNRSQRNGMPIVRRGRLKYG